MQVNNLAFEAIGTHWNIETILTLPDVIISRIHTRIKLFDKTYSRFRSDSLVAKIAKQKGRYVFPNDASQLINFYDNLYELTHGKITPTIGSILEQAGYDADYSFIEKPQTKVSPWHEVAKWTDRMLITNEPVTLDFGAAGKGYLVDIVAGILDEENIKDYVVNASGDLRHKGRLENRVGLEHPYKTDHVIGMVDIRNESLCASSINRRVWGNGLHHIFDPDTQKPVRKIIATWVITEEAMIADGIATALFFVEPQVLMKHYEFQYVRMHDDLSVDYSKNFNGEIF